EREELRVVNDQHGAPTSSIAIADATAEILQRHRADAHGLFHLTAGGETTWFGFTEAIIEHARASLPRVPRLVPITTAEYPTPAKRPAYSVLSCAKVRAALGIEMTAWPEQLDRAWKQYVASAR
ncbi:MAG: sugar nucleotide-binding protein, partial [Burkholderiales bacterium]